MKAAWDRKHCKSVRAWALAFGGEAAGRIVWEYSDNPAGSNVTCSLGVWAGPLAKLSEGHLTGTAGGGGYEKASASFDYALHPFRDAITMPALDGLGLGCVEKWLTVIGYKVLKAL